MNPGSEQRQYLLRMQRERLCHAYHTAIKGGLVDPVIWLVDQEDTLGRDLCQASLNGAPNPLADGKSRVEDESIIAYIIAISRQDSATIAGEMSEQGLRTLTANPPPGYFHVVVVSAGGNLYGAIPQGSTA